MIDILTGCIIEYLLPYSPDYQPIKLAFSVIKSHLQRCGLSFFTYKSHYYKLYKACEVECWIEWQYLIEQFNAQLQVSRGMLESAEGHNVGGEGQ